jgi:hypothetical protein
MGMKVFGSLRPARVFKKEQKKALLFEKRSKNFYSFRGGAVLREGAKSRFGFGESERC